MKIYTTNWYFPRVLTSPKRLAERTREKVRVHMCISTLTSYSKIESLLINGQVVGEKKRMQCHIADIISSELWRSFLKRKIYRYAPNLVTIIRCTLPKEYSIILSTVYYKCIQLRMAVVNIEMECFRLREVDWSPSTFRFTRILLRTQSINVFVDGNLTGMRFPCWLVTSRI